MRHRVAAVVVGEEAMNIAKWLTRLTASFGSAPWLILIMLISFSTLSPHFLSIANLRNISQQASVVGVLAVGITCVMITSGIDLSVGALLALSSVVLGAVHQLVRGFANQGRGILYVSHQIGELELVSDRIVLMRDGGISPRVEEG